jgi:hypothetical protein
LASSNIYSKGKALPDSNDFFSLDKVNEKSEQADNERESSITIFYLALIADHSHVI